GIDGLSRTAQVSVGGDFVTDASACVRDSHVDLLLFLFYGSGHPRDLHSFPTRRSSDLLSRGRWRPAAQARSRRSHCGSRPRLPADRKSTRLNSSHLGISYAVFCLKKKNFTVIPRLGPDRINAAYAAPGPPLTIRTVEDL